MVIRQSSLHFECLPEASRKLTFGIGEVLETKMILFASPPLPFEQYIQCHHDDASCKQMIGIRTGTILRIIQSCQLTKKTMCRNDSVGSIGMIFQFRSRYKCMYYWVFDARKPFLSVYVFFLGYLITVDRSVLKDLII